MRVLFLDDDAELLQDGLADLDGSRYQIDKCTTIETACELLTDVRTGRVTDEDMVLFVDHDLGAGRQGYELVEWIRRLHPHGQLLPIIYLTGRESERGYLAHQRAAPYRSPSGYLSKRELARTSFDINEFIARLAVQYQEALTEADTQRLDSTVRFFESVEDDVEID